MKIRELEKLGFERAGVYNAVIDGWLQREAPPQLNLRRPGVYVFCIEGKAIYAGSSIDEKRGVLSRLEAYRKPRVAKMRADKQPKPPRPIHLKLR